MNSLSCKLGVLSLEDRSVMSAVAYGDFNGDSLVDVAAITSPNSLTVSLAIPGGGYTVAAVLTTPNNRPITDVYLFDANGDGNLDVRAVGTTGNNTYFHTWLGDGEGAFGPRTTVKWSLPHHFHGGTF